MSLNAGNDKAALRRQLMASREAFLATAQATPAQARMGVQLADILSQVEAECVGLYWPLPGEWRATDWAMQSGLDLAWALPFAQPGNREMHYRHWDGTTPTEKDGCGIPTSSGKRVQPDVILAPCVGFNAQGFRLGYGGGYFDRHMAAHPGTLVIGMAWHCTLAAFDADPHDHAPAIILTEQGIWET